MSENKQESVLIIDDDASYLQQIAKMCSKLGYNTIPCSTIEEFFRALETSTHVDYVIVDQFLEDCVGLELIPAIKRHIPGARIVLLTGFANLSLAVQAGRMGAYECLSKPVSMAALRYAFSGDPQGYKEKEPSTVSLEQLEWEYINRVLNFCAGNVSQTARCLGLHRRTLQRKLARRKAELTLQ